jgi:hypothetical protein
LCPIEFHFLHHLLLSLQFDEVLLYMAFSFNLPHQPLTKAKSNCHQA